MMHDACLGTETRTRAFFLLVLLKAKKSLEENIVRFFTKQFVSGVLIRYKKFY